MIKHLFEESVGEFEQWKTTIAKELKSFRLWLRRNQLCDEASDSRIMDMLDALNSEFLTIAFAGEFSRGKTELINAIFFSDYGQRILPSQAGRTTMCPTELYYDSLVNQCYLRLLPIETRKDERSLSDFRDIPDAWQQVDLDSDDPKNMAEVMLKITETRSVNRVEAMALGFDSTMLDEDESNPELVEIPAWRHALVSFDHPLLKQGLRIVDTPGLNALGSEPELTYQLLPQAQAVVFVLAADAGVTASDMQIWEEHIEQLKNRPNLGLYAVLNKIDVLWDDLSGRKKTEKAINRVIRQTSRHLKINESDILPVSAHKALLGRVKHDKALILRSQIGAVESILSETILGNKETAMWQGVIEQTSHLIADSQQVLKSRKQKIHDQIEEISNLRNDSGNALTDLLEKSKSAQIEFKKRHVALKPSQRLLERQSEVLMRSIGHETLNDLIQRIMRDMVERKTTVGMMRSAKKFYQGIDALMTEFCREAELSNKMAESMYNKFERDFGIELLQPRYLRAKIYRRELNQILDEVSQVNRNVLFTFTEQSVAVKRFFGSTVSQITKYFKYLRQETRLWTRDVILPLFHQVNSLKDLLDANHKELTALHQNEATVEGRLKALNSLIFELDCEIKNAEKSLEKLTKVAPKRAVSNVVELARMRR